MRRSCEKFLFKTVNCLLSRRFSLPVESNAEVVAVDSLSTQVLAAGDKNTREDSRCRNRVILRTAGDRPKRSFVIYSNSGEMKQ